jgi:hypothetical protein
MKKITVPIFTWIVVGLLSCNKDDGSIAAEKEAMVAIDPEIELALDQMNPLGFKYTLENDKVVFVKVFDSYTDEAVEASVFMRSDADALAQKFADLIPYDIRKEISFLYLTGSRPEGDAFSGFVSSIHSNKNTHWLLALGVGTYLFTKENEREDWFKSTVIHEYAHIKSANDAQAHKGDCIQNELDSGNECFKEDSYVVRFNNIFWRDIIDEWNQDGEAYYNSHKEDFVTGYASSNYFEDFAESFTAFVLEPDKRPEETIAGKKVNFFYQYPYWISIRNAIREKL